MIFFCGMACAVAYAIYCGISDDIVSQDFFEVSEQNSCGIACVISYEFLFCDVWLDLL